MKTSSTIKHTAASAKGQVTIPIHIRRKLGIQAGTVVRFVERGDMVALEKVPSTLDSLCGMINAKAPIVLEDIDEQIATAVRGKVQSKIAQPIRSTKVPSKKAQTKRASRRQ
jgi:AbrB family looped-hinge helix DNA binding protein